MNNEVTTPLAARLRELAAASRELLLRQQAGTGAFPACPDYPVYRYCWFRDGAFIADGLSRIGEHAAAAAFHGWCAGVLTARAGAIEEIARLTSAGQPVPEEVLLPARYTLDGRDAQEPWWNFQLDGYGTWLWALAGHLRRSGEPAMPYRAAVQLAVRYLSCSWQRPCYDWWEENHGHQHVATLAAIDAGLRAALTLGVLDPAQAEDANTASIQLRALIASKCTAGGHLVKWLGSSQVDGSLLACIAPFATVDRATSAATLAVVEHDLVRGYGVYRHREDTFYGGGRWPVLAGFLGLAYLSQGRGNDAMAALTWIASTAVGADLPEQVGPVLHPERIGEWERRWGTVATPLLWSHAMYLVLADALGIQA